MQHMAAKHYIPSVVHYTTRLADSVCKVRTACPSLPVTVQTELLQKTSTLLEQANDALHTLDERVEQCNRMDGPCDLAVYCRDALVPAMDALRRAVDGLELLTDKDLWPVPTYGDLMFEV